MGDLKEVLEELSLEAQYDANAKEILAQKLFLANILVRSVEEFKGQNPREVMKLIEGEPLVGMVRVDPGFTNADFENENSKIIGKNKEDNVHKEGVRFFDVLFDIWREDGFAKVNINIEAQKTDPKTYDVEMRGNFYVARLISSQLNRVFCNSDYNKIQKVYSIWICMNCGENTFNRIHLYNEDIIGKSRWKDMYDVFNVELIRLKGQLDPDVSHELHRLIGTLFLPTVTMHEKEHILEKEFDIILEKKEKELVGTMCNLGEGIKEQALQEGKMEGKIEGKIEGKLITQIDLIAKKVLKQKNLPQIAAELEETEDAIRPIYEAVLAEAPVYDVNRIYHRLCGK